MGDAGVGEQALEVCLWKRGQVSVEQGEDGNGDEQRAHFAQHQKGLEHA